MLTEATHGHAPGQAQTIGTRHDVQAEAEQQLINMGYPNGQLQILPEPADEVGRALVRTVARLCGDVVRAPLDMSAFHNRVLVVETDERTGQAVEVWK